MPQRLTDGYRSAPVFLKHFSVQCNIFLCKGSHQVEANFQINTEKWRATLQQTSGFFFFFLFHPLAPVSETKRSLVTHLSSVLKNPSDFSGAKNKSFFSFFFFFWVWNPLVRTHLAVEYLCKGNQGEWLPAEPKKEGQLAYSGTWNLC